MPKVKPKRHVPTIDMTAMVDVAFLLLTFFILTTKFKAEEAVVVDTPSSISEIPLPEQNIMVVSVDRDGKVYCGFGNKPVREAVIDMIAQDYKMTLTEQGRNYFSLQSSVGVPFNRMESWLNMDAEARNEYVHEGVPYPHMSKLSKENELKKWIMYGRKANPKTRFAIKGDQDTPYEAIRDVIDTFQNWKINKFNLVTSLEGGEAEAGEEGEGEKN